MSSNNFDPNDPSTYQVPITAKEYASIPTQHKGVIDTMVYTYHRRVAPSSTPHDTNQAMVHKGFVEAHTLIGTLLGAIPFNAIALTLQAKLEEVVCLLFLSLLRFLSDL